MQDFDTPADMGAARRLRELDRARSASKSLTVGFPPTAPGTGGAYARENLSDLITSLDYELPDAKLWNSILKQTIDQTVHQYDVIKQWGYTLPESRGQGEIARPRPDTATVVRMAEQVATFSILGQVSDTAQRSRLLVDPVLQEVKAQTMQLVRSINNLLYYGDKSCAPLTIDGYYKKIMQGSPSTNVVDCKGAPVTLDDIDSLLAVLRDAPNYAQTSVLHWNPKALSTFNRANVPAYGRFDITTDGTRGINTAFDRYRSILAGVDFVDTVFIQPGSNGVVSPFQDGTKAPTAPTVNSSAAAAPAAGQSSFFYSNSSDAGSYTYFVQAINPDGVSPMTPVGSPVNVAAGDVVNISVTAGSGPAPSSFIFFRLPVNAVSGQPQEVGRIPNLVGQNGAAAVTFTDTNIKRPGCTEVYFFDTRPDTMYWASLCALEKQDYAKIQSADEFALTIQGVNVLRAPTRLGMLINVGY